MKRNKIIIIVVIILFLVLLIPIKTTYKDGGTTEYKAILYKVIKWNKIIDSWTKNKTGIQVILFPHNFHALDYYDEDINIAKAIVYDATSKVEEEVKKENIIVCNIGTYSWSKKVEGKTKYVIGDAIHPIDMEYKNMLETKSSSKIYIENVINIKSINIYKTDDINKLNYNIIYDEKDSSMTLPKLSKGEYIVEFYVFYSRHDNVYYSFKINVN